MDTNSLNELMLQTLQSTTPNNMANALYSNIRKMIMGGVLPSGYSFPNETAFCKSLGVGRTTLREAYKALESNGLITRSKRGTTVNSREEITDAQPFSLMIEMSDFNELLEFRMIFESELAALAAQRATEENINNLKRHLADMKAYRNDLKALTFSDTEFHIEIAHAAHNQLLYNTMSQSADTFFKVVYSAFQIDTDRNVDRALYNHERILNSIKYHDPVEAKRVMSEHIHDVKSLPKPINNNN